MAPIIADAQFGIDAMVVAVPAASMVRVLIREFYWQPIERREQELTGAKAEGL